MTSVNQATPFALTRNVFVLDMQTAQIARITAFADTVNLPSGTNGSGVVSACVLPWFKAFSPDHTRIAVAGVVYTGINMGYDTNSPSNSDEIYSGFQGTPALQIFSLDGTARARCYRLVQQ